MTLAPTDPRHGTMNGYCNLKCRCQPCRDAWAAYFKSMKASWPQLAEDDPRHGTPNGYGNYKCRCDACRAAWTANARRWSKRVAA